MEGTQDQTEGRHRSRKHAAGSRRRVRIVVADDDQAVLGLIRDLLSETYDVLAGVPDGRVLVRTVDELRPDVAIADISMPIVNGIEATRMIRETRPEVRVIALSIHEERAYVDAAFEAGAWGYVLKISAGRDLIPAVESVVADRRYVSPRLSKERT